MQCFYLLGFVNESARVTAAENCKTGTRIMAELLKTITSEICHLDHPHCNAFIALMSG